MFYVAHAFAEEPRFATYHEIASVIVDQRLSNNVTASVSLQTTSIKEFQIPPDLDLKIRNNTDIVAVVITNEDQCVLGVQEQICVMINIKRTPGERGITAIQQKARQAGDSLIGDINSAFGLDAKFHSVFLHYDDKSNRMLETTGEVSGAGTVSAVYTMPLQNTDYLFNKISGVLIPRQIREFGGFYLVATELAKDDDSRMTFTILPKDEGSIMQLKVSKRYPHVARDLTLVDPLQYLKVNEIKKSDYFSVGFFPLNSLVYVVILPHDNSTKAHPHGNVIEATIKNNERIPSDLTKSGWFFNSESAQKIEAMYLFGEESSATKNDLMFTLDKDRAPATPTADYEFYLLIGIGAAAAAAAAFYFKGFRSKKSDN
ncbi:MAG TPA: hypothetical protein VNK44_07200 [Candidatus Nitrosotenuis sp.]|nr:hypothetical protein [Candidatus Nitrosotenuis sp.]